MNCGTCELHIVLETSCTKRCTYYRGYVSYTRTLIATIGMCFECMQAFSEMHFFMPAWCLYAFVSHFVGVSKAPPVQYIPYCTLNGCRCIYTPAGAVQVYTHTGAKLLAKIIIDQEITWSNRHTVQK